MRSSAVHVMCDCLYISEIDGVSPVSPVAHDVKVASSADSSTCSGGTGSDDRLEEFLGSCCYEPIESEAFQLMNSCLSQNSFLVDPGEVHQRKQLCTTGKNQILIGKWHGQKVAMKQLMLDPEDDPERFSKATRDLMREIHVMSKISHPCLVKLLGANLELEKPFLMTEFLEYRDVETLGLTLDSTSMFMPSCHSVNSGTW